MTADPRRRALLLALAAAPLAALPLRAEDAPILIDWPDLIPPEVGSIYRGIASMGVVEHGALSVIPGAEEAFTAVTDKFNGKRVKMPGFIIPLDDGVEGVREILLAPFVGACIHVPPPPPNQLVYVKARTPYRDAGLFDPVWVTGIMSTAAQSTELADVGYMLDADTIEPYDG